jgi:hypothetical protein
VSFQSVLVEYFLFADIAFNMFSAIVDDIGEMLSVLMNVNDALGGLVLLLDLSLKDISLKLTYL